jgi:hypothetical protein
MLTKVEVHLCIKITMGSATNGLVVKYSNINVQAKVRALKFENSTYLKHYDPLVTEGVSIYK